MAVIGNKKTSVFSIHSLKKAIKKLIKKTRPAKEEKKVAEEVVRVDFEAEIEDNLANEALEARLLQMIEASPATLDLDLNLSVKGSLMVKAAPDFEIQFGTFWTTEDDKSWTLCKDLFAPAAPSPRPANTA
ncbi:uncharacterized protein LOC125046138 [Penaeus chinensis]|uniref:uncharacterized protein LOC125046138 n=1 Tax=Penaeus chinensis TaxID=139456 RepID=UPI001FB77A7E|nr:uncharacterized protein LOC125046138 [Penaeus chinensis]